MHIQQNLLRLFRKRAELTQADIAAILKISDFSNVSRWEQGLRLPNVEVLMTYHLLFDIPIETIFERHKLELRPTILPRIKERIEYLKTLGEDAQVIRRIAFFSSALQRLTDKSHD
ncbi:MAG: helix-turn-helix transcriptional regulator [Bacteroidetes bacterium]|nr:helix-turn-helix transcriptional regulator [Bacteroidota bacterium]